MFRKCCQIICSNNSFHELDFIKDCYSIRFFKLIYILDVASPIPSLILRYNECTHLAVLDHPTASTGYTALCIDSVLGYCEVLSAPVSVYVAN